MEIVPGYDFGAIEVPNRAKLGLMASGMTLTGIELSQVATTIVAAFATDGSLTSMAEGALWLDARSNLWGRTSRGIVRVRMAEGGWETNRYPWGNQAGNTNHHNPGNHVDIAEMFANNTNESNCFMRGRVGAEINRFALGIIQETANSTATNGVAAFYRVVGRGATRLFAPAGLPPSAGVDRVVMDYTAPNYTVQNIETGGVLPQGIAESSQDDPDGDNGNYCYAYLFNLFNLD